jgi:hypothetical protein
MSRSFMKTRPERDRIPLSLKQFYTRGLFLPFVVMVLGFLLFAIGRALPSSRSASAVGGFGGFLSLVGVFSFVPYGAFLILAWPFALAHQGGRTLARASWLVPPIIAIGVAIFLGAGRAIQGEPEPFRPGFLLVWSGLALIVGYTYVAIIHFARVIASKAGWIRDNEF